MKTSPFGLNRAEQFDDLLEGRIDEAPEELTRLLEFANRAWAVPPPEPRSEFTAALRERLMAEAPTAMAAGATDHRLAVAPILPAGATKRRRRIAAAVAVVSLGAAATGTAFAAEDSLPGQTLYPIKRLVESAHTAISVGDTSKGTTELSQARTRLTEATTLAQTGQPERAAETLQTFITQATKGATLLTEAGKGEAIHDFTTTSVSDLDLLSTLLPSDVVAPVLQALVAIDQAVSQALPGAGPGITSLPNSLVQMLASALTPQGTASPPTKANVLAPSPGTAGSPSAPGTPGLGQPTTTTRPTPAAPLSPKASATPKASPTTLGEVVGGIGDGVGNGVVGGLGGALSSAGASAGGPVGGLVNGVGGAVTGVGGAVSGLLNGVGGLLSPPSSSATK